MYAMKLVRRELCVSGCWRKKKRIKMVCLWNQKLNLRSVEIPWVCVFDLPEKRQRNKLRHQRQWLLLEFTDSFQVIRKSFVRVVHHTLKKKGQPKEVSRTKYRAGKQNLTSPMATFWWTFNTDDWITPRKKTGNLNRLSSEEGKRLLWKKAKEVLLNSPLQEEHNCLPDYYGFPAVCDLLAYMQLEVDKEKWLGQTPLQIWRNRVLESSNFSAKCPFLEWLRLATLLCFWIWPVSLVPFLPNFELVKRNVIKLWVIR